MSVAKIIRLAVQVMVLLLLLVLEDGLLWLGPKIIDASLEARRVAAFEKQCSGIKPGMTMNEAVETMSRGPKAQFEAYRKDPDHSNIPTLVFWRDWFGPSRGGCVVALDPSTKVVTGTLAATSHQ